MIYELLGVSCVAFIIATAITPIVKYFWYYKIFTQSEKTVRHIPTWKPFECKACMGWWLGLIYFSIEQNIENGIFMGAICYVLNIFISKYAITRTV